jgi:hypothetical protein
MNTVKYQEYYDYLCNNILPKTKSVLSHNFKHSKKEAHKYCVLDSKLFYKKEVTIKKAVARKNDDGTPVFVNKKIEEISDKDNEIFDEKKRTFLEVVKKGDEINILKQFHDEKDHIGINNAVALMKEKYYWRGKL